MKKRSIAFITAICVCAVLSCMGQMPVHADDIPGILPYKTGVNNATYLDVPGTVTPGTEGTNTDPEISQGDNGGSGNVNGAVVNPVIFSNITEVVVIGDNTNTTGGGSAAADGGNSGDNSQTSEAGNSGSNSQANEAENTAKEKERAIYNSNFSSIENGFNIHNNTAIIDIKTDNRTDTKTDTRTDIITDNNITGIRPVVKKNRPDPAAVNLSGAAVSFTKIKGKMTYTGKKLRPAVKVVLKGKTLVKDTDYTVKYKNNIKAGTASVIISGKGGYIGSAKKNFKILKAKNTIKLKSKKKTLKYSKVKKKSVSFAIKASVKGKAKKKFKKIRIPKAVKEYIKVSSRGKVTVKHGIPKGTWKIKVKVTASAVKNYKKTAVKKTYKIIVK